MLRIKLNFFKSKLLNIGFFVFIFLFIELNCSSLQAQQKTFTIVLDAGHGGRDPGNLGTKRYKTHEKDIALDVTLKIGKILKQNVKGIKVLYTRTKDVYPDLWKRAELANKADADLFVSIHCNSFKSTIYGTETYVLGLNRNKTNLEVAKRENDVILLEKDHEKHYQYDPNSPESIIGLTLMQEEYLDKSIELAQLIENSFVKNAKRHSRGVKQAGLIVLHQTFMPSVLVEIGFLTNRKEEDYLNSKSGQFRIANAIALAIKKYVVHTEQNEITINNNFPIKKEPKVAVNTKVKPKVVKRKSQSITKRANNRRTRKSTTKKISKKETKAVANNKVKPKNLDKKPHNVVKKATKRPVKIANAKKLPKKSTKVAVNTKVKSKGNKQKPQIASKKLNRKVINKNEALLIFKVQIASSTKKIETKSYNFKGAIGVKRNKLGGLYKYYLGKSNNYETIKRLKSKARKIGFKQAFIVVFKDGKQINIQDALKTK